MASFMHNFHHICIRLGMLIKNVVKQRKFSFYKSCITVVHDWYLL